MPPQPDITEDLNKAPGRLKVLFLPAWYPNRLDPMWGLFVQRHAQAVQIHADLVVAYVQQDPGIKQGKFELLRDTECQVVTYRLYYRPVKTTLFGLTSALKLLRFLRAWCMLLRTVIKEEGLPQISHVHVLTRTALPAYWLKLRHSVPYVITEHWSRYLPANPQYRGFLRRWLTSFLVGKAGAVSTVTRNLGEAMQGHGLRNPNYMVIPNCVDTSLFKPSAFNHAIRNQWLHVSVFDDRSKNISGMLRAVAAVADVRRDFHLTLVGDGVDLPAIKTLANQLGISHLLTFKGLQQGEELATSFAQADLLLLFSHYENIPVVINEAMACGIPVLATRVGGIPEYLDQDSGIMVEPGDEPGLKQALLDVLEGRHEFDSIAMRERALREFSYDALGLRFMALYQQALRG